MTNPSTSESNIVRLAATSGIRDSAALKEQLLPLLQSPDAVVIDVSEVEHVDTAALQLLFAFARDRKSIGLAVLWQGDSPAWRIGAAILNPDAGTPVALTDI